ncbi:hypothetical protein ASF08_02665 [Methylobacterium sp. Leaf85]|nr:hypothetical protein ASF08_02665 [Methylobacterium sp. Leaf85]
MREVDSVGRSRNDGKAAPGQGVSEARDEGMGDDVVTRAPNHERRLLDPQRLLSDAVVDHAPQGQDVASDAGTGIIRERHPGERPALERCDGEEADHLPDQVARLRVRRGPLQHEALHELGVNQREFDQHFAAERIPHKGCALHPGRCHEGRQCIRELANRERAARLFAQSEAGQVGSIDLDMRGEMICQRDHVPARHPEPMDEDDGYAVIRHSIERDAGMHRPAVDSDPPRFEPARM